MKIGIISTLVLLSSLMRPVISLAVECTSEKRLNEISTITVKLNEDLLDVDGTTIDDHHMAIHFSGGGFVNSDAFAVAEILAVRTVAMVIRDKSVSDSTLKPFACTSVKIEDLQAEDGTALHGMSSINFDDQCPIQKLETLRTISDFRSKKFTLGSLRFNLGKRFTITAECSEAKK